MLLSHKDIEEDIWMKNRIIDFHAESPSLFSSCASALPPLLTVLMISPLKAPLIKRLPYRALK
jgi:hypothetical protein